VENFFFVEPCLGDTVLIRAEKDDIPRRCGVHFQLFREHLSSTIERCVDDSISHKSKDPSGGTTGRVEAIWALGVDGRSRLI
jgi:hypothetical protein